MTFVMGKQGSFEVGVLYFKILSLLVTVAAMPGQYTSPPGWGVR
jgi:hypothetical protein